MSSIKSLSGKGVNSIEILSSDKPRPQGCVAFPVGSSAAVFLHVKGLVDLDAEITKASKKLEKTKGTIDKQRKMVTDPGYLDKVAVATQQQDKQRLADLEAEAKGFEATIEQFKQLKLE